MIILVCREGCKSSISFMMATNLTTEESELEHLVGLLKLRKHHNIAKKKYISLLRGGFNVNVV